MRLNYSFLLLVLFLCTSSLYSQQDEAIADTTFVKLKHYSTDFVYDMKYATEDNFL